MPQYFLNDKASTNLHHLSLTFPEFAEFAKFMPRRRIVSAEECEQFGRGHKFWKSLPLKQKNEGVGAVWARAQTLNGHTIS